MKNSSITIVFISLIILSLFSYYPSQASANTTTSPCKLDIAFLLDVSGSMGGERLQRLKESVEAFVNIIEYSWEWRVGIVTFSDTARIFYNLTNIENKDAKNDLISAVYSLQAGGGTNIYDAMLKSNDLINSQGRITLDITKVVILVSDGEPTVGPTDLDSLLSAKQVLENNDIVILTFFVGDPWGSGDELMYQLASKPDYFFNLTAIDPAQWRQIFADFANKICGYIDTDGDTIPDNQEHELALKYLPILVFDSQEQTYPTRVEFYYENIGLYRGEGDQLLATKINNATQLRNLAPAPWINQSDQNNYYIDYGNDQDINVSKIIEAYNNSPYRNDYTVYYHVTRLATGDILVDYWFFYPINNPPWLNFDLHEGDWEHIALILRQKGKNYEPDKYFLSQHFWIETVQFRSAPTINYNGNHIVIAVPKGSHANYAYNSIWLNNILPFAERWDAKGLVICPNETGIIDALRDIGISQPNVTTWTHIINLGEPTNYKLAYDIIVKKVIGENPFPSWIYGSSTRPNISCEFIDSKIHWGKWGIFSGPEGPAMHVSFYSPALERQASRVRDTAMFGKIFGGIVGGAMGELLGALLIGGGGALVGKLIGSGTGALVGITVAFLLNRFFYPSDLRINYAWTINIYSPIKVEAVTDSASIIMNETSALYYGNVLFTGNASVIMAYDDALTVKVHAINDGPFKIKLASFSEAWGILNISISGNVSEGDEFAMILNSNSVKIENVTNTINTTITIFANTWNKLVNNTFNVLLNPSQNFVYTLDVPVNITFDKLEYRYGEIINASVTLPEQLNNATLIVEVSNMFIHPQLALIKNFTGDHVNFSIDLTKVNPLAFIDDSLNIRIYLFNNTDNGTMILGSLSKKVDVVPHDVIVHADRAHILGSAPYIPGNVRVNDFYLIADIILDVDSNDYGWILTATYNSSPTNIEIPGIPLKYYDLFVSNTTAINNMTIMIHYDPEELRRLNANESDLTLYYWDGENWIPFNIQWVDTENKLVWAQINKTTLPQITEFGGTPIALGIQSHKVGGFVFMQEENSQAINNVSLLPIIVSTELVILYLIIRKRKNK